MIDPDDMWWMDTALPTIPDEPKRSSLKSVIVSIGRAYSKAITLRAGVLTEAYSKVADSVMTFVTLNDTKAKYHHEDTTRIYPTSYEPWEPILTRKSQVYTTRRPYRR